MITILGPTATGKTQVAVAVAQQLNGEIISADSRQVFRRMTIGTGKDLDDYILRSPDGQPLLDEQGEPRRIAHHLIDILEPGSRYSAAEYRADFLRCYADITGRGKEVIQCGGTGLYIESVLQGYAFEGSSRTAPEGQVPQYSRSAAPRGPVFGLLVPRDVRRERITRRLHARLHEGMVDEIQSLLDEGITVDRMMRYGLEYKYVTLYCIGQLTYDDMVRQLEIAIHQFAKRQMTWFRGMERRGITIHWIDAMQPFDQRVEDILREVK